MCFGKGSVEQVTVDAAGFGGDEGGGAQRREALRWPGLKIATGNQHQRFAADAARQEALILLSAIEGEGDVDRAMLHLREQFAAAGDLELEADVWVLLAKQ